MLRRKIVKVDKITMEPIEVYGSITECANDNSLTTDYVWRMIEDKTLTKGRYILREMGYNKDEDFTRKAFRPVKVTDEVTGKEAVYCDAYALSKRLGITVNYIIKAISCGAKIKGRLLVSYYR